MSSRPLTAAGIKIPSLRLMAEQAFSRAAGAPLTGGNSVELLIDATATFPRWLEAIHGAQRMILCENYIYSDDRTGRAFRDALAERAAAGVRVCVVRDWLGCQRESGMRFWTPLIDAGGEVRTFNPPSFGSPLAWLARDHRKLLTIDAAIGFVGGLCVSDRWLGDAARGIPPWRDTAIAVRGPVLADLIAAFGDTWAQLGAPLDVDPGCSADLILPVGHVDLRVIATVPNTAGLYRLDQLIAAMASENLWLADAYFVGVSPYVQGLVAAARDGVDVRLLVPGTSDIPMVGTMSRAGYRPLLDAGVRVFEWNGSMMHAKTAVADGRWARVGSSNLNVSSWLANCEIDVAIEDAAFAREMEAQYLRDLENATEIVLRQPRLRRSRAERRVRGHAGGLRGSSGRAAAGALRLAHTIGAAISNRRTLDDASTGPLLGGGLALLALSIAAAWWPRLLAWPLALLGAWIGAGLLVRWLQLRRRD